MTLPLTTFTSTVITTTIITTMVITTTIIATITISITRSTVRAPRRRSSHATGPCRDATPSG